MRCKSTPSTLTVVQVIERHFLDLQHATSISGSTFVANVREYYEANYPEHARGLEWSRVTDIEVRMRRDYDKFKRWFDTDVRSRFPLEILESVVSAFPPERRFRLQIELAGRQGMLAIPMPTGNPSEDGVFLGRIAKETGEAIIAIAQLLEDGAIDSRDKDKAPADIADLDEAIAVMTAMKALLQRKALGKNQVVVMGVDILNAYKTDPTKID
jgi:hypothetical protein